MLKLEKNSRHGDVTLRFRETPLFLTKEVRYAFGIACAFHFIALLLFHVAPFKLRHSEVILPPVMVMAELPQNEPTVVSQISENERNARFPTAPKKSLPTLPELPETTWSAAHVYKKEDTLSHSYFKTSEYKTYFAPKIRKRHCTGKIKLCGPLGTCEIASQPQLQPIELEEAQIQRFTVRLDGETGRIIWYSPVEENGNFKFHGESLLSQLIVKGVEYKGIIEGEVEVIYD